MAITVTETQVTWPTASNTGSVITASSVTSEEFNLDATCINASISFKAANAGTPVAADVIYFWLIQTSGDPDGASTDEFDTTGHGSLLAILDTNTDDPALKTVLLPLPQKGGKIYAEGSTAGTTQTITVSCTITEQRAA